MYFGLIKFMIFGMIFVSNYISNLIHFLSGILELWGLRLTSIFAAGNMLLAILILHLPGGWGRGSSHVISNIF